MPKIYRALRSFTYLPFLLLLTTLAITMSACSMGDPPTPTPVPTNTPTATTVPTATPIPQPTSTLTPTPIPPSTRASVPTLCYHHVRDWRASDTEEDRVYIVSPAKLDAQLKYLKDNGYHAVTSEQIYQYYANGRALPDKPVMLTFDDNDDTQYTNALPLLKKYGFNATFFIMTVTVDKENYMTSDHLKELDKDGFDLQPHTWDHHMVTQYKTDDDWQMQIVGPKKMLEDLLGHPTPYFAYPYGVYNAASAAKIKSYGYKAAFRLSEVMDKDADPLFAIPRRIANGYWKQDQFIQAISGDS